MTCHHSQNSSARHSIRAGPGGGRVRGDLAELLELAALAAALDGEPMFEAFIEAVKPADAAAALVADERADCAEERESGNGEHVRSSAATKTVPFVAARAPIVEPFAVIAEEDSGGKKDE